MTQSTYESVQDYYGKVLQSKEDLQTSACCIAEAMPKDLRLLLSNIHEEIQSKFYGCGSPIPPELEGCTVLDLGCGTGRDVYLLSQLVGEKGMVIGVDMTDKQLDVARKHIDGHMEKFGFKKPNVRFEKSFIEDLKKAQIEDSSIDVVISNCVINLSPNKKAAFKEIFRVLKPGGELYFSDVFASAPISKDLQADPVLFGECLSGAMHIPDFESLLEELGFDKPSFLNKAPIELHNPGIKEKIGHIDFYSITVRSFKPAPCCAPSRKSIALKTGGCC